MQFRLRKLSYPLATAVLVAAFAVPPTFAAQAAQPAAAPSQSQHLVSPSALQHATVNASRTSEQNRKTLRKFFSSPQAKQALKSAHIKPQEVNKAIAGLSNHDLAQLAQRVNKAQANFAAGQMTNHTLLLILVFFAALILIIVAVH